MPRLMSSPASPAVQHAAKVASLGAGTPVEEVKKGLDYMRAALA